ncbi:MAG: hypothetical protein QM640_08085 [Niabella sp.]
MIGDSSSYYEKILSQPDFTEEYAAATLTADSIIRGTGPQGKVADWPDYLSVSNKNKTEEQSYLDYYRQKRKPVYARSALQLTDGEIAIDNNGNWSPVNGFMSEGYWSWSEKVSTMLPVNYHPKKTENLLSLYIILQLVNSFFLL